MFTAHSSRISHVPLHSSSRRVAEKSKSFDMERLIAPSLMAGVVLFALGVILQVGVVTALGIGALTVALMVFKLYSAPRLFDLDKMSKSMRRRAFIDFE